MFSMRPMCQVCRVQVQKLVSIRQAYHYEVRRSYATSTKAPKDRAIQAEEIKLIDEHGSFKGSLPLKAVLSSYDSSTHTLLNLTPNQEVPTCRIYTIEALRGIESQAYQKKREKSKVGSDPAKVLKECTLNWNVTEHDLKHKLDSGLSALKKGNKLDVQIGLRTKRHAKATPSKIREELVERVVQMCAASGREWKTREGNTEIGVTLHFVGNSTATKQ